MPPLVGRVRLPASSIPLLSLKVIPMPSDTPTPAEIVGKIAARLRALHFDGTTCEPDSPSACSNCYGGPRVMTPDELGRDLTAALSEHYHLLPKAEVVVEYTVAWTADNGNVIPFGRTDQTVWRPGADRELAALQAEIQKDGGDDADRYYVAQRLQSRWAAADVAEELK